MSKKQVDKSQKLFQAIVLAENLINIENFYCLQPCPIECPLEKTLQLLEKHSFNEIFIFCSEHYQQVKQYISQRRKSQNSKIKIIHDQECDTFASIMRSFYSRKIITEDFILIQSHLISDINLTNLKEQYIKIIESQKGVLMTEVFMNSNISNDETNLVVWNKQNNLIEFLETVNSQKFIFEDNFRYQFKNWFKEENKSEYIFNFNVLPSQISFCSKNLLGVVYTMNEFFMQKDMFLKEVLTSEISAEQIGILFIDQQKFHKVVNSPYSFFRASLLQIKSCFEYFYLDNLKYTFSDFNQIIAKSSQISISNQFGNNIFLGENTKVGENAIIENSIICQNVIIKDNCIIKNCYVTDNCVIGNDCNIENCILMEKITLENNFICQKKQFINNNWQEFEIDKYNQNILWDENSYVVESDEEDEEEQHKDMEELKELLDRYQQEPEKIREVITEIKSFWLGEGIELEKRFESLFEITLYTYIKTDKEDLLKSVKGFSKFSKLLKFFINSYNLIDKETILKITEKFCIEKTLPIHLLLQQFYEDDILCEESLKNWGNQKMNSTNENDQKFYELMKKFLLWLDESEDESEEEESEEDD